MRINFKSLKNLTPAIALSFSLFACSNGSPTKQDQNSQTINEEDVKKELTEAVKSIEKYSANQKNEALKQGRESLDEINLKVDKLQQSIDSKWESMSKSSRDKALHTMNNLKDKQKAAEKEFIKLRSSSTSAWGTVKAGFLESYSILEKSFKEAYKELNS